MDSQPLLKVIDRYRAWSQAHSSAIVQEQDEISRKTDDVLSKACRIIADLSRSASVVWQLITKHEETLRLFQAL
ncbi:g5712 [Coccomyxa viridis]|uniref:G5712 protein n=1 Tax=Coccomyxa viridis TaxID=1274662 RepID=A0ABP1FTK0_9CHLO